MIKLAFVDTETTGIAVPQFGLLQVAIIVDEFNEGQVRTERCCFPVRPFETDLVDAEAMKVNGLTREIVESYPEPMDIYRNLTTFLNARVSKFDTADKLHFLGYNARFDADHLRAWFTKCGDKFFGSYFWNPPIDIMNLLAWWEMAQRPMLENFKLHTVCRHMGVQIDEVRLHEAMYDVELARKLYYCFCASSGYGEVDEPELQPRGAREAHHA